MHLKFIPTRFGGGVKIEGDTETLHAIERLLTQHAMDSHCCFKDGACLYLSKHFEKNDTAPVDWVTLFCGITTLRSSAGFLLNRQEQALITTLEYELECALCQFLKTEPQEIAALFVQQAGHNDHIYHNWESRATYIYLLKTAAARRKELIKILESLCPMNRGRHKDFIKNFEHFSFDMLDYTYGERFQFPL
ncbi:hypothetical protein ACP3V3_19745 [Vibrio sp. PNB22_3_1]